MSVGFVLLRDTNSVRHMWYAVLLCTIHVHVGRLVCLARVVYLVVLLSRSRTRRVTRALSTSRHRVGQLVQVFSHRNSAPVDLFTEWLQSHAPASRSVEGSESCSSSLQVDRQCVHQYSSRHHVQPVVACRRSWVKHIGDVTPAKLPR